MNWIGNTSELLFLSEQAINIIMYMHTVLQA